MKHLLAVLAALAVCPFLRLEAQSSRMLGDAVDVSADFSDFRNTFFLADRLASFDPVSGTGTVSWKRTSLYTRQAFDVNTILAQPLPMLDFPGAAYEQDPTLRFRLDFVSPRTFRLRMLTSTVEPKPTVSPMLVGEPPRDDSWTYSPIPGGHRYRSAYACLDVETAPFRLVLRDADGRVLTQTRRWVDNDTTQVKILPFCFLKRGVDNSRAVQPVFSLSPGEKIFGCGESFTRLDKRGQRVHLWVTDPQGPETGMMYKPVPFFLSSKGYGLFMHTSAPVTCDFGQAYVGATRLFMGDENLDLFLFVGKPADVLDQYTDLTGKAPLPPLWSFGTWMSRITYFSQQEGLDVAARLREHRIPSDVIHFDTGWFGTDWQCDYVFAPSRFDDAARMIRDLLAQGFHISLWQLPYFTPKNRYFGEIVAQNLHVRNGNGEMPYEDAVLDFTNPETVRWYQDKLAGLLRMGVGAIKVDFGEAAPLEGVYANGRTGWYEHNLYPLRYNQAVAEVTERIKGEHIIWARSAWAGSQRYPLHWGGDAANTDMGMEATLRGGLSFGLSGFPFWSHDIGGFVQSCPEELYRRWLPFGFLSSHSRAHGAPPKEPWLYDEGFVQAFRQAAELKYSLMPYVYAQAKRCTETGLPMVRALFLEFPDDPGAWLVDDAYLFGADLYVAPLMTAGSGREVYLPGGSWKDYQTGRVYGPGWHRIEAGSLPCILLQRDGTAIPQVKVAQSTDRIDWTDIRWKTFSTSGKTAKGLLFRPADQAVKVVVVPVR